MKAVPSCTWRTPEPVTRLDRQGRVRAHCFGAINDLSLGVALGRLPAEPA